MNETFFPRFEQLIAAHTGLHLRPRERDALRRLLADRMAVLRLRWPEAYEELLESGTLDAAGEWEYLTAHLTNNESYFFRDRGQMTLLRERILPELIARNRGSRTLRLWSAGCSTGEEAYSLAILIEDLLPRRGSDSGAPWEIVLLGTDIDEPALQQARKGRYTDWSFRTVEASLQRRYFVQKGDEWQIRESSRALVTFARCNLFTDPFPRTTTGLYDMDLILCRNVFIYFAEQTVAVVLAKFAQTLRPGGYLMTGHAETPGRAFEPMQVRMLPGSLVYQRVDPLPPDSRNRESLQIGREHGVKSRTNASVPPASPLSPLQPPRTSVATPMADSDAGRPAPAAQTASADSTEREEKATETLYLADDYQGVIDTLGTASRPAGLRSLLMLGHAYANLGRRGEATDCCRQGIEAFPFASEPYELLAALAQEKDQAEEAKELLKKAVYLSPTSATAYVELAALYAREGDRARARKMRVTALELLQQLPEDRPVGFPSGPPAQEWIDHLTQLLTEGA